jgi:hypothetical protein
MKSYPITFDLYRKLIKEPLNERVTILLNNEFSSLRQSLSRPVKPVNSLCKLNNGVNYLIFEIDNTPIPVSLFKFTREITRGWRSTTTNSLVDFIVGIYLEKRFQDYEDKIKAQVADGLQNNYSAGDWVIRRLDTTTKYIHNVYHKARLYIGEKLKTSSLIRVTPLTNLLTKGDYVITNSNYPDQLVNLTVIDQDRILIPEFCEVPADMNKMINKIIFINNLIQLNPTVIN